MTVFQFIFNYLFNNGMFEKDANAVVERAKADTEGPFGPMAQRWNEPLSSLPPQMKGILSLAINHYALAYIDETCPKAGYRALFVPGDAA